MRVKTWLVLLWFGVSGAACANVPFLVQQEIDRILGEFRGGYSAAGASDDRRSAAVEKLAQTLSLALRVLMREAERRLPALPSSRASMTVAQRNVQMVLALQAVEALERGESATLERLRAARAAWPDALEGVNSDERARELEAFRDSYLTPQLNAILWQMLQRAEEVYNQLWPGDSAEAGRPIPYLQGRFLLLIEDLKDALLGLPPSAISWTPSSTVTTDEVSLPTAAPTREDAERAALEAQYRELVQIYVALLLKIDPATAAFLDDATLWASGPVTAAQIYDLFEALKKVQPLHPQVMKELNFETSDSLADLKKSIATLLKAIQALPNSTEVSEDQRKTIVRAKNLVHGGFGYRALTALVALPIRPMQHTSWALSALENWLLRKGTAVRGWWTKWSARKAEQWRESSARREQARERRRAERDAAARQRAWEREEQARRNRAYSSYDYSGYGYGEQPPPGVIETFMPLFWGAFGYVVYSGISGVVGPIVVVLSALASELAFGPNVYSQFLNSVSNYAYGSTTSTIITFGIWGIPAGFFIFKEACADVLANLKARDDRDRRHRW